MKESKPEWYKQAENGPFDHEGFREEHKRRVLLSLRQSEPPRTRQERSKFPGRRFHWLAVPFMLLFLAGGAWLWWSGNPGDTVREKHLAGASRETPPPGVSKEVWHTAQTALTEIAGKEMKFVRSERPDSRSVFMEFRGGDQEYALFSIDTATQSVTRAISTALLNEASIDPETKEKAEKELKAEGFTGSLNFTARRHVLFRWDHEQQDDVQISLRSGEAHANFVNGDIESLRFELETSRVPVSAGQAAKAALTGLNSQLNRQPLTRAYFLRYYDLDRRDLDLKYGENAGAIVNADTYEVIQAGDWSLRGKARGSVQIKEISRVKTELSPLVKETLGVDLKDYKTTFDPKTPYTVTFVRDNGESVHVAYNLYQYVHFIQRKNAVDIGQ